jgi:hypothetical protein
MKNKSTIATLMFLSICGSWALGSESYYGTNHVLSARAAGQPGSTAIHMSSNAIVAWADGFEEMQYGAAVDEYWQTPEKGLGSAQGIAEEIVCLGRGGQITLTFSEGIGNGMGADFAVFENGVTDGFLELGYVEVASDGTNFVRFPGYSYTPDPVAGYGEVNTRLIYGLASKYRLGYGTPFGGGSLRVYQRSG